MNKRKTLKPSLGAAAVVTGAGNGIGRSFAYEIVRRGGSVICADISEEAARKTAEELSELGVGRALAHHCDVSDEAQVRSLAQEAEGMLGRPVTLVINNAGVVGGGRIGEAPLRDWHTVLDVNLWGVIHGCHYFVPRLRELGYGGIINVASAAGFCGFPRIGAYNASKSAVMALSETLAAELTGSGIHVSVLCPTGVKTDILDRGRERLPDGVNHFANNVKDKWVFMASPDAVARGTLDALDRNQLYVLPQFDSRLIWRLKRYAPSLYARTVGEVTRLASV